MTNTLAYLDLSVNDEEKKFLKPNVRLSFHVLDATFECRVKQKGTFWQTISIWRKKTLKTIGSLFSLNHFAN
jgi:hypothetical protein